MAQWAGVQSHGKPGEQASVTVEAKNIGKRTWNNSGDRLVSLYTVRPNYRESSLFIAQKGWLAKDQVQLATKTVLPGKNGSFTFTIQAPAAEGEYAENFRLAVEEYSWVKNGEVQIALSVATPRAEPESEGTDKTDPTTISKLYKDTTYDATYLVVGTASLILNPAKSYRASRL